MRKEPIVFPLNFQGKSAVFEGGLAGAVHLQSLAPEAIAAPLDAALELAKLKTSGHIELPSLGFALVVLTNSSNPHLDHEHHDLLWRAFQVPIFEQFRALNGDVIARECETHDGLHLAAGSDVRVEQGELWVGNLATGLTALLDSSHCDCGDGSPRLTVGGPFGVVTSAPHGWAREAAA